MTLSDLGSLGDLLAAIATIATLAYLALQIRQSNRAQELAAATQLHDSNAQWIGQLIQTPIALETYLVALSEPEKMTFEQRARFNLIVLQALRGGEAMWTQTQSGLLGPGHWSGMRETIRHLMGSEAGQKAFEQNRRFISPGFAAEVERVLSDA